MIGFYNYTVVLTYLSLLSAGAGIMVSLSGKGHPYLGIFFLLFCGLCDAFDGKVARTKKNRSEIEKNFGIQIDSLSDIVAFGILPACIGVAMLRTSSIMNSFSTNSVSLVVRFIVYAILLLYMLSSLVRLAYFNVTEEERQKTEGGVRKYYTGLPVTSASLIFPTVLLIQYITSFDITPVYFVVAAITGYLFLSKLQVKKPGLKGILIMVGIGAIEGILLMIALFMQR